MEGIPENGVNLEILGITRCPTEREDGRARRRSVERDKVPHHKRVYLSANRRGKMGKDSAHDLKIAAKGRIGRNHGLQGVSK